jgi:hypothetical protein
MSLASLLGLIKPAMSEDKLPQPPGELRYRVHGGNDIEGFRAIGKACARDIEAGLRSVGRELTSFRNVLDWGCG